jgi:hypothetical protein
MTCHQNLGPADQFMLLSVCISVILSTALQAGESSGLKCGSGDAVGILRPENIFCVSRGIMAEVIHSFSCAHTFFLIIYVCNDAASSELTQLHEKKNCIAMRYIISE